MSHCCGHEPVRSDITLKVSGMSCAHCKKTIETSIGVLPGVSKVEAIVDAGEVNVTFDPSKVKLDDIKKAVEDAGYDVRE